MLTWFGAVLPSIALREDKREWSNKALDAQAEVAKLQHHCDHLERRMTSSTSTLQKERSKIKEQVSCVQHGVRPG